MLDGVVGYSRNGLVVGVLQAQWPHVCRGSDDLLGILLFLALLRAFWRVFNNLAANMPPLRLQVFARKYVDNW